MVEMSNETRMEKLELLSRTAVLKQGLDLPENNLSAASSSNEDEALEELIDNKTKTTKSVSIAPQSQHLLSLAVASGTGRCPSIVSGERRSRTTSPSTLSLNTSTIAGGNIPSPVSTDGEDDGITKDQRSNRRHNIQSSKPSIIESRSPVTTVDQIAVAPSSPSFPSSPSPYGFYLYPNGNQSLHHQQDHVEYGHPYYSHSNGNIIRTLSEASFAPPYAGTLSSSGTNTLSTISSASNENLAAFRPPQNLGSVPRLQLRPREPSSSHEDMAQRIMELREQLSEKDILVSSLQNRIHSLENQISELRQLPTGKISHIPVDDMIRIMQEYGSEVSNQTLPQQRKQSIKKASIVRQFRRWNPNFFQFFLHHNGEWVPKLGKEGELRRRAEKRRLLMIAKQTNIPNGMGKK